MNSAAVDREMALVPVEAGSEQAEAPTSGFWRAVGTGLSAAARCVGRGFSAAFYSVDPDARRDIAKLPLMALTAIGRRHGPVFPLKDDGCRPIVFVHGLGGHRGNFWPMRAFLRMRGRSRTYAVRLPGGHGLERMAETLREFIEDVVEVNDLGFGGQVDVVAHSMGGVVCRLAVEDPDTAGRIATLITLGSPHGGTQAARWAGTRVCGELRPGSAVLTRLGRQLPWPGRPRLVCFWSRSDPLMQPAETARVPGADNREATGLTHMDWVLSRQMWEAVCLELDDTVVAAAS